MPGTCSDDDTLTVACAISASLTPRILTFVNHDAHGSESRNSKFSLPSTCSRRYTSQLTLCTPSVTNVFTCTRASCNRANRLAWWIVTAALLPSLSNDADRGFFLNTAADLRAVRGSRNESRMRSCALTSPSGRSRAKLRRSPLMESPPSSSCLNAESS
jgi:hypothetical protein